MTCREHPADNICDKIDDDNDSDDDDEGEGDEDDNDSNICLLPQSRRKTTDNVVVDDDDDDDDHRRRRRHSQSNDIQLDHSDSSSLSSIDDDPENNKSDKKDLGDDDDDDGAKVVFVPSLTLDKNSVWGSPGTTLYTAMQQLTIDESSSSNHRKQTQTQRSMETPSAFQAEQRSIKLHNHIHDLILEFGTIPQQTMWKNACVETQSEWIVSFFLKNIEEKKPCAQDGGNANIDDNDDNGNRCNPNVATASSNHADDSDDNDDDNSDEWGMEELVFPTTSATAKSNDHNHPSFGDNTGHSYTQDDVVDDGGDDYWSVPTKTSMTDTTATTTTLKAKEEPLDQNVGQSQQQKIFLVDMTQLSHSSIHCQFDKNGVNDMEAVRTWRKRLESKFEEYHYHRAELLADGTIVPCSIGVWKAALVTLRKDRPGHYICPIFQPKS